MKSIVLTPTVISFKYAGGVLTATDMHGTYGGLSKFTNLQRTFKLSSSTIISYTGEYSDIMFLHKALRYEILKDNIEISPIEIHRLLQRVIYGKRSDYEPINVNVNVLGKSDSNEDESLFSPVIVYPENYKDNGFFLGSVNEKGNFFFNDVICTGFGAYLVTPFLREKVEGKWENISRDQAVKIAEDAMRILIYRDCFALNKIQIGIVESNFCDVSQPYVLNTEWEMGREV
ncbi:hypothetical protein EDEG_01988 [Edhazardia aedis USNM 41457]|uniref:Proteasome subunit beta n=1 Tax=Edhazardia aedis (strain USNM 41457) TaxID=1003232 RepID=J9DQW8_EDHAE|nr:hypothetical protein EDEG_01988 [Edhazardia aedis USNM 41457]|eukprot:EJW03717.1 hypothetical protein EDEG_01988 [Edhazardia aedis USNM 41457]